MVGGGHTFFLTSQFWLSLGTSFLLDFACLQERLWDDDFWSLAGRVLQTVSISRLFAGDAFPGLFIDLAVPLIEKNWGDREKKNSPEGKLTSYDPANQSSWTSG